MSARPARPPRRPDEFQHHVERVDGVDLHFVREGAGFPLVLLHGWPGFWYEWHLNIPVLARAHVVIAPDLRGFALSGKPDVAPEEGYTAAVAAQDVIGLMERLGHRAFGVVAHDIGARVAQALVRARPDLVPRLTLFDPPYPGIGPRWREPSHAKETWYQLFHQLPLAEELLGTSRDALRCYLRHFLRHWSYDRDLFGESELEHYVEAYAQPGALRGAFGYYRAYERLRLTEAQAPRSALVIRTPTLILWGENDVLIPPAWADRVAEYFTDVEVRTVPRCGHFLMREQPDLVNAAIREWFAGCG